jgi:hypothetical protein
VGLRYDISVERIGSVCSDDDTLILWYWFLIFVHRPAMKTNRFFGKVGLF